MVAWSALGWVLVVIATCALLRRRPLGRRQERLELLRLAASIRRQLASRHPGVEWRGFVAGSSTAVLEVEGQETAVPLHRLRRELGASSSGLPSLIDRLIGEVRSEALEEVGLHLFGSVATAILPQVRTDQWVERHGGRFGDAGLVTRRLGAGLVTCYVVDEDRSMTFVTRRHLGLWGRSARDIHRLAIANLRRRSGGLLPSGDALAAPRLVHFGDGYDAARVLLIESEATGEILVGMPNRDELWLAAPGEGDLAALMARPTERPRPGDREISASVYRVTRRGLELLDVAS